MADFDRELCQFSMGNWANFRWGTGSIFERELCQFSIGNWCQFSIRELCQFSMGNCVKFSMGNWPVSMGNCANFRLVTVSIFDVEFGQFSAGAV